MTSDAPRPTGARRRNRRRLAAATLYLACVAALASPLDDMRRQVEASQFEQAWATAQANPDLIGDVHFDFLYGVAAINVGKVAEGLLALERHLDAVPANDRARLELARGYFLLGEYARARQEFEFVLRYNPPAGVRANIAGYLQAMQVRELAENRTSARLYAESGFGHSTNVNGGTAHDLVQTVLGPFTPDAEVRQRPDNVFYAAAGGQKLARVSNRLSVFAGFDLSQNENFLAKEFNLTNGNVSIGLTELSSRALWRLTLSENELMVGGNRYRNTLGLAVESNFTPTAAISAMLFGSYEEFRHAQPDGDHDARNTTVGALVSVTPAGAAGAPTFGLRTSYAQEQNQRLRPDLSNKNFVMRLYAAGAPRERLRVSAGLTAGHQTYGGIDTVVGTVRGDIALALDASASYVFDERWQLRGDTTWSINRSNQDLHDYRRNAVSLKVRYQY